MCCPPNALKYLAPDYSYIGKIVTLEDGVEFYESSSSASFQKAVIVIPDIFGWNSGRTRNIADFFAEHGYYAIIPRLLTPPIGGGNDGDGFAYDFDRSTMIEDVRKFPYQELLQPRLRSVTSHIKSLGIQKVVILAFCWGAWAGCHLVAGTETQSEYVCMAMGHPSIHVETFYWKLDTQALVDRTNIPVFILPAKGDPDEYRVDGSYFQSFKGRYPTSRVLDFPEEDHGFIPRGDLSNETTKQAVDFCLQEILLFFEKHVAI